MRTIYLLTVGGDKRVDEDIYVYICIYMCFFVFGGRETEGGRGSEKCHCCRKPIFI
jgi:hypothetical protein